MGTAHGRSTRRYMRLRATFKQQSADNNTPCHICGQPIDYTIPWKDQDGTVNDDAFELDHIYPVSTHPEHAEDPAGFRASHRACNRKRSNKLTYTGIGQTTRVWTR